MLPHLLTLTRAAVPGLTLIHPDCHLLGKKFTVHFSVLCMLCETRAVRNVQIRKRPNDRGTTDAQAASLAHPHDSA